MGKITRTYIKTAERSVTVRGFSEVENSNFSPILLSVHNNQIVGICSNLCVLGAEPERFQVYLTAVFSKYFLQPNKQITFS